MSKDEQEPRASAPHSAPDPRAHDDHAHDAHDDDHAHEAHGDDHDHDDAPLADLPATPVHGYWKSLRELDGTASFQVGRTGHEFPPGADQPAKDPLSRRNFFHLMGASMA